MIKKAYKNHNFPQKTSDRLDELKKLLREEDNRFEYCHKLDPLLDDLIEVLKTQRKSNHLKYGKNINSSDIIFFNNLANLCYEDMKDIFSSEISEEQKLEIKESFYGVPMKVFETKIKEVWKNKNSYNTLLRKKNDLYDKFGFKTIQRGRNWFIVFKEFCEIEEEKEDISTEVFKTDNYSNFEIHPDRQREIDEELERMEQFERERDERLKNKKPQLEMLKS